MVDDLKGRAPIPGSMTHIVTVNGDLAAALDRLSEPERSYFVQFRDRVLVVDVQKPGASGDKPRD